MHAFGSPADVTAGLLGWPGGFGTGALIGIKGTGSCGAGPARHMAAAGVRVVEAAQSDRQDRRRKGKSDPLDSVSAAWGARSGRPAYPRAATARRGRSGC
jgi:transposase